MTYGCNPGFDVVRRKPGMPLGGEENAKYLLFAAFACRKELRVEGRKRMRGEQGGSDVT